MKKYTGFIFKLFVYLLISSSLTFAQECFTPASNTICYSDDLTTTSGWTKGSTTVTDDTPATPPPENMYGVSKAFKLVLATAQVNDIYGTSASCGSYIVTNTLYKISTLVKYSSARYLGFGITGGATYICGFDLVSGTVGTCAGILAPSITNVGGGWWYIEEYYVGNSALHPVSRLLYQNNSSSTYSASLGATGGEILYVSSPEFQPVIDSPTEMKKYVPNLTTFRSYAPPRNCSAFEKNHVKTPSELDDSSWAKNSSTVTANSTTTHDGLPIADTVTKNTASALYGRATYTISNFLSTPDFVYYSAELKAGNVGFAYLGSFAENSIGLQINLTTGAVSHIGSSSYSGDLVGYHIEQLGSSWWRVHLLGRHNFTAGSNTTIDVAPLPSLDNTMTGSGENGNYVYVARVRVAKDTDINPTLLEKIRKRKVHSATTTVITLDQGVKYADAWIGREICIDLKSANRLEECHCITSASAGSRTVTVSTPFAYTPAIGDIYRIGGTCEANVVSMNTDTFTASALKADASAEIREDILTRPIEGNYSTGTLGNYIERIKKYVANRMTKAGSAYTVYKDDKTTVFESGTTNGAGRTVP